MLVHRYPIPAGIFAQRYRDSAGKPNVAARATVLSGNVSIEFVELQLQMSIHLFMAQLLLDLPDSEPLFALEFDNLSRPFDCYRAVESQVPRRVLFRTCVRRRYGATLRNRCKPGVLLAYRKKIRRSLVHRQGESGGKWDRFGRLRSAGGGLPGRRMAGVLG